MLVVSDPLLTLCTCLACGGLEQPRRGVVLVLSYLLVVAVAAIVLYPCALFGKRHEAGRGRRSPSCFRAEQWLCSRFVSWLCWWQGSRLATRR